MTTGTTRLTDHERRTIARARELLEADDPADLGELIGEQDPDHVYPVAFGYTRELLGELAAIVERLGGDGA